MDYPRRVGGSGKTVYRRDYKSFRGVDFSSPPERTDAAHSPDAVNIMSDDSGALVKRPGYRPVGKYDGRIFGIHRFEDGGVTRLLVHAGNTIWLHGASPKALISGVNEERSVSAVCGGRLWILTGREYLVFDKDRIDRVRDIAYVPTVKIGCDPATGAGTLHEAVNLLSDRRRLCFLGDGETLSYMIDADGYDSVESVTVNGCARSFSEDPGKKSVTFQTAPSKPPVPGQDNVEVVYRKSAEGNAEAIERCRVIGLFGAGGADADRLFFSGNPKRKNVDWHCGISAPGYGVDPTYVPDTSFACIGSDGCGIVGYRRLGSYQVILKEQNDQDASMFLRSGGLDAAGETCFYLTQGASGIGAAAAGTLANLGDEPLFLSKQNGICGITTSELEVKASVQNRSWFVDSRLKREKEPEKAFAAEWKGRYLLALNGHVYVLDSRQAKTYREHSGSGYVYECFFWDNVPAVCFCESDGELFFGTRDGFLCKFSTDCSDDSAVYRDISGGGEETAVCAWWTTGTEDDGFMGRRKKCLDRQCAVLLRQTGASASVGLDVSVDGGDWTSAAEFVPDCRFSFEKADFSDWSFFTCRSARSFCVGKKLGKYTTLSLRVKNCVIGENLLCEGITRSFFIDKKLKG
ncbi:MAG: hypothetical protein PUA83_05585 [Clostridiales bacterium]|nr:hypothetical protein [Clostridiales bacterium]